MLVELPPELRRALEAQTAGVTDAELARVTRLLSDRYRVGTADSVPLLQGDADVAAYAAYRFPATYAAAIAAMSALRELRPEWQPQSFLDLGAGPGSGMWAASVLWPSIERIQAVDAEPRMIATGKALSKSAQHPALRAATWRQSDLSRLDLSGSFDLTLIAYVLGEMAPSAIDEVIGRAWRVTADALVVIEPGTPEGYRRVEQVRDQIVRLSGHELAPCPHDPPCRVPDNDWMHFSVRLPRSRAHRLAKDAVLNYEDEKFSYLVLARSPLESTYSRILRHPQVRKGHIHLQLCTRDGVQTIVVSKREGERYRRARKAEWGDIFEWDEPEDGG